MNKSRSVSCDGSGLKKTGVLEMFGDLERTGVMKRTDALERTGVLERTSLLQKTGVLQRTGGVKTCRFDQYALSVCKPY